MFAHLDRFALARPAFTRTAPQPPMTQSVCTARLTLNARPPAPPVALARPNGEPVNERLALSASGELRPIKNYDLCDFLAPQ